MNLSQSSALLAYVGAVFGRPPVADRAIWFCGQPKAAPTAPMSAILKRKLGDIQPGLLVVGQHSGTVGSQGHLSGSAGIFQAGVQLKAAVVDGQLAAGEQGEGVAGGGVVQHLAGEGEGLGHLSGAVDTPGWLPRSGTVPPAAGQSRCRPGNSPLDSWG